MYIYACKANPHTHKKYKNETKFKTTKEALCTMQMRSKTEELVLVSQLL